MIGQRQIDYLLTETTGLEMISKLIIDKLICFEIDCIVPVEIQ